MPRFTVFKSPRYCPNAAHYGHAKYQVSVGDLVLYRERYEGGTEGRRLARVLGLVNQLPDGKPAEKNLLLVLAASDMLNHAYERYVKIEDVLEVRSPSKSVFAQWFLSGPVPEPEVAIAAVKYGCVNDNYIDGHLEDGELKASFRAAAKEEGLSGQDRKSYSDSQDRKSYRT